MHKSPAFTIVEILIVLGILSLILVPAFFSLTASRDNQALVTDAYILSDTLKRAHIFARESKDEFDWGVVSVSDTSFQLVSGAADAFSTLQTFNLHTSVRFVGPFTVWFLKRTGESEVSQTIELKNSNNQSKLLTVSESGIIEVK